MTTKLNLQLIKMQCNTCASITRTLLNSHHPKDSAFNFNLMFPNVPEELGPCQSWDPVKIQDDKMTPAVASGTDPRHYRLWSEIQCQAGLASRTFTQDTLEIKTFGPVILILFEWLKKQPNWDLLPVHPFAFGITLHLFNLCDKIQSQSRVQSPSIDIIIEF